MNVVQLARDLLQIPSPSGAEREIGEFLVKRLERNFTVQVQAVGTRFNILATRGKPKVLLATHIDTVPKQLPVYEDEEFLYGRGACDTKGIVAAMVCAAEDAVAAGITGFGLLFDVSEETDFSGIRAALELASPELVVVGEPTRLKVGIAQKGIVGLRIKCVGKTAPGATPELGTSAIEMLIDTLNAIRQIPLPASPRLGETTLNICMIGGGSAVNVVPEEAEATIEIRTTQCAKDILELLRAAAPNATLEVQYSFDPVFAQVIPCCDALGVEQIVVPFFTEMYFWSKKSSVLLLGPGDYRFAHGDDERIAKVELLEGVSIYRRLLQMQCKSAC
jgi:acetylornithine deacetylase